MELIIRQAEIQAKDALIAIALAAKGHWGSDAALLRQWEESGILDEAALQAGEVWAACTQGRLCGWCRVITRTDPAVLEDLWVLPEWMGRGIGRALFEHARAAAQTCGAGALVLDADPNAAPFYERMGCRSAGEVWSSWGRMIPHMRLELPDP